MSRLDELKWTEEFEYLLLNKLDRKLLQNPLLKKDIWHTVDDLGLKIDEHERLWIVNFSELTIDWLKLLVKLYILNRVTTIKKIKTIRQNLTHLKRFSFFLVNKSVGSPEQINLQIFEEFDYYLRSQKVTEKTRVLHYISLKNFFDVCRREGWLDLDTYWFKGKCNQRACPKNDEIVYIPEEVWHQLDQNLHYLPEPIQRMVLVIRTTGIRVGELLNLPLDCLRKRGKQWRLRLTTEKYNIEDELPIPPELATVIKEQQEYIREHFGQGYQQLFCSNQRGKRNFTPYPSVMYLNTFNRWLNQLAKKRNICAKDGQIWHFTSHQFRRTVGTIFTNAGIRDLIIQKYLRHRSPDMQHYYKHLLKQVLQEEYEELMQEKKYVDNTGKIVASHQPKNPVTELLRRKMYQITTQYGECHRPNLKAPCQTVNACWRCQEWRVSIDDLPYLQEDLRRVEEELKIAEELGMVRQKKGLEDDRNSLINCLRGLREVNA